MVAYCYSEPFMMSGEVDTDPSQPGQYKVEIIANQLPGPDGLHLPFNLVRYGWVRGKSLTMSLLKIVDPMVHKSCLCCHTRNCTMCSAGDGKLKLTCSLEKMVEHVMFLLESTMVLQVLSPMKMARYQYHDGILWSTGRFDSSAKFKFEDVEMDLPFYDDSRIAPVVPVVRDKSDLFHSYAMFIHEGTT